ncbi:hypothetical protein [Helicobacter sp.]|nr:hypothetical protein [Helicobacter sp.]MCI5632120.1 hypothetical protein [Helicobacter sp.]MDY5556815.1 hypothetical protein [Helicobacter sp.]
MAINTPIPFAWIQTILLPQRLSIHLGVKIYYNAKYFKDSALMILKN